MKPANYRSVSMTIDELFDAIFDDQELWSYLRAQLDEKGREKMSVYKIRRKTLRIDAKRNYLVELGFIETQPSLWKFDRVPVKQENTVG